MSYILLNLRRKHKGEFLYYTQYQVDRDNYIRPTPLLIFVSDKDPSQRFLVDFFPALTFSWLIKKRLRQHQTLAEDNEEEGAATYPHVLFIAGNNSTENRLVKLTQRLDVDFRVFTTTFNLLADSPSPSIWQDPEESFYLLDDEKIQHIRLTDTFDN
jgi:hypothetical protein